jgi:hypothetical protein
MTAPTSVINSTMNALPLLLIAVALLSAPAKAASVQVSVSSLCRYSKQFQREFVTLQTRRVLSPADLH